MIEYIAFFVVSIISIFAFLISYKKIVNERISLSPLFILILIAGSLITTVLNYFGNPLLKTIFTFIFFVFIFKYKSNKSKKEIFYYALILWIYGLAIDFVNMIIVSVTNISQMYKMLYVRTCAGIIVSIFLVLFCSIPIIKKFTCKTIEKIIKINPSFILDFILILVLIILSVICFVNINKLSITIFSLFISISIIILIYLILAKNYKISRLKEVNNILIKNNDFFVKLDSDYRALKHNLIHQLSGIKSAVKDKKVQNLIDDLIISYNANFVPIQDIHKIPGGINGLIYEKCYSFDKKDIRLAIDNSVSQELIDLVSAKSFNNLCEILGVLLDNALEAASDSEEKIILIDFTEEKNYIVINISNTFNNQVDIDKLGQKSYSTKGKNHGIGLFSIFSKKNIQTKTRIINNLFQTEIKVKKVLY